MNMLLMQGCPSGQIVGWVDLGVKMIQPMVHSPEHIGCLRAAQVISVSVL